MVFLDYRTSSNTEDIHDIIKSNNHLIRDYRNTTSNCGNSEYKTTKQVLEEISEMWDMLPLGAQSNILNDIACLSENQPTTSGDSPIPSIDKVIFNNPATIVYWKDGTKTVVKCQVGDTYTKDAGLAMCIAKKALGNKGSFNDILKKWCNK